MNVILCGFKSSGKSHYGKKLADRLNWNFIDTDRLIEELYFFQTGQRFECRQILIKIGEQEFRHLEGQVIEKLPGISKSVVATGGGSLLRPQNVYALKMCGKLVYLEWDWRVLKKHILSPPIPSFLDPHAPDVSAEKMFLERHPVYEKVADVRICLDLLRDEEVIQQLLKLSEGENGK